MIERLDRKRRLAFLPLGDPRADVLLGSVPPEERRARFWLAEQDGDLAGGGRAAVRLLSLLGAAPLAELPGIGALVGRGYDLVSSVRGALGRVVPDRPGPRRFP
jgi:hypothetical protein